VLVKFDQGHICNFSINGRLLQNVNHRDTVHVRFVVCHKHRDTVHVRFVVCLKPRDTVHVRFVMCHKHRNTIQLSLFDHSV
jgi:hypothetical protein